jgi:predicted aldo/keto reductase-like oxidoreductase
LPHPNFKHSLANQIKEKAELAAKKGIGIVAMKTMAGGFMDKERQKPVNCVAALKWVLQDPNIHTSIPGIISYDQMMQNFSVMENLEFTEKEKADLEEAKLISGLYCDGCSQCNEQCKKHLPVQDYMRAYMYTYGYRNYENAYSLIGEIDRPNPCGTVMIALDCHRDSHAERITDARLRNSEDLLV